MTAYKPAEKAAGKIRLALTRLAGRYPFHAGILEQLTLQERPGLGQLAITVSGKKVVLLFNPTFVLALPLDELIGSLLHEVHHILFGHILTDPQNLPDDWARTVAQEVTANEYIKEPLPDGVITLELFPDFPANESTARRYERLCKVTERFPLDLPEMRLIVSEDGASGISGQHTLDDHDIWEEARADLQGAQDALQDCVQQAVWRAGTADLPQALCEALQSQGIGVTPGTEEYRLGNQAAGRLDWRQLLRRYLGNLLEPHPSLSRPPRRFPHLAGILPARSYLPLRPRLLVAIDTSSSISDEMLEEIAGELRRLARGHIVTVAECDVKVHKVYPFRTKLEAVTGRGGTDLRPPLEPTFLRKYQADVVIYFTDGFGPVPERSPPVPVVWCVTVGGKKPTPWGTVVALRPPLDQKSGSLS
jgi:predicted metal-dependent peptidase